MGHHKKNVIIIGLLLKPIFDTSRKVRERNSSPD